MVNWESEYKKHLVRKYEKYGLELNPDNISIHRINVDLDLSLLTDMELCRIYADYIMTEQFEHAETIRNEIKKRDCEIEMDIDEKTQTGYIRLKPKAMLKHIEVSIIVTPDGLMVDFDKEDK